MIFHECLDLRHAETSNATRAQSTCFQSSSDIVFFQHANSAVIPMFAQQSSGDHRNTLQKSVFHVVFRYTHFSTFKLQGSLCYPMFWFISLIVSQPRNPVGQVKVLRGSGDKLPAQGSERFRSYPEFLMDPDGRS